MSAAPTHTVAELKRFYLAELASENCTLREALALALREYAQVSSLTEEVPHRFTIQIEGTPEEPIHFDLENVPFWRAVEHLCALAGMKVDDRGPPIRIVAIENKGDQVTKLLPVPPTFASDVSPPNPDPFDSRRDPLPVEKSLRDLGILRSAESSAIYTPRDSQLLVRASARDHHRVESFREMMIQPLVMVRFDTRVVEVPAGGSAPTGIFSPQDTEQIFADLLASPGAQMVSQPTVTSHLGQSARLETGSSIVSATGEESFIGERMELRASRSGFQLRQAHSASVSDRTRTGDVSTASAKSSSFLPSGHSFIDHLARPDGSLLYYISTPTLINATGQPVADDGGAAQSALHPAPTPSP